MQAGGTAGQQRVSANHPSDLYADYDTGGRVGLVAICRHRPAAPPPLSAIKVDVGERSDGRWTLRYSLQKPALFPVFAALSQDIVRATDTVSLDVDAGEIMLERLNRWRTLLERDGSGLSTPELLGLIGELITLKDYLTPLLGPEMAIAAWKGPFGASHDFLLPDATRIEVKTTAWQAEKVRISSLAQLDIGAGPIVLAIVRVQQIAADSSVGMTASTLISQLQEMLGFSIMALKALHAALAAFGWHDHPAHDDVAVRLVRIDAHAVVEGFPRLTAADMPQGVSNVAYDVTLPRSGYGSWLGAT